MKKTNTVSKIFKLRNSFIVIGLTGRTGSGCSTVAELLRSNFNQLFAITPTEKQSGLSNDERKYKITYKYLREKWAPFDIIKASDIIFLFVLLHPYEELLNIFQSSKTKHTDEPITFPDKFKEKFERYSNTAKEFNTFITDRESIILRKKGITDNSIEECAKKVETYKEFLFKEIPEIREAINNEAKKILNKKLYREFQEWGNKIREFNAIIPCDTDSGQDPSSLARKINLIIKMLRDYNEYTSKPTFIAIDALRNPYEVLYFRERYSGFYLMSISTEEKIRREKLYKLNYREEDINELDSMEYPSQSKGIDQSFFTQDVEKCIELSDIFVVHKGIDTELNGELKTQLITYLALMMHPGLVPPSPQERIMQIAFAAKLNSGCISRQVGAAVTDPNFSLKSIGWNTVPEGQTPCSLCSFEDLIQRTDASAFSEYEKTDKEFRKVVETIKTKYKQNGDTLEYKVDFIESGLTPTFCFKDIYTVQTGKKNQVHTRSLHAEENAFLQLAKYGSQGISGGKLFTTASPCELCAKKAYQLGIKDIYYIDAYPGISLQHILNNGSNSPKMHLFSGAIGRAYDNLYNPLLPLKDEIAYLTGLSIKDKSINENNIKKIE